MEFGCNERGYKTRAALAGRKKARPVRREAPWVTKIAKCTCLMHPHLGFGIATAGAADGHFSRRHYETHRRPCWPAGFSGHEDDTPWLEAIKRATGRTGAGDEPEGMRENTPPSENRPDLCWLITDN